MLSPTTRRLAPSSSINGSPTKPHHTDSSPEMSREESHITASSASGTNTPDRSTGMSREESRITASSASGTNTPETTKQPTLFQSTIANGGGSFQKNLHINTVPPSVARTPDRLQIPVDPDLQFKEISLEITFGDHKNTIYAQAFLQQFLEHLKRNNCEHLANANNIVSKCTEFFKELESTNEDFLRRDYFKWPTRDNNNMQFLQYLINKEAITSHIAACDIPARTQNINNLEKIKAIALQLADICKQLMQFENQPQSSRKALQYLTRIQIITSQLADCCRQSIESQQHVNPFLATLSQLPTISAQITYCKKLAQQHRIPLFSDRFPQDIENMHMRSIIKPNNFTPYYGLTMESIYSFYRPGSNHKEYISRDIAELLYLIEMLASKV